MPTEGLVKINLNSSTGLVTCCQLLALSRELKTFIA